MNHPSPASRRAVLLTVSAMARRHGDAIAHYEAGADEDAVFWSEVTRMLESAGVDAQVAVRRLREIVDGRSHIPGQKSRTCTLCVTLNEERRQLSNSSI